MPRRDSRVDGSPGPGGAYEAIVAATLFLVIGLVLPRTPPKRWVGIRTPWTLSSAEVWARTHRFAAHCLVAAGIASIVDALLPPPVLALSVLVAAVVAASLAPMLYSWLTSRHD